MLDFSSILFRIPALLIALTFHEYAHALAADAMGDATPRFMGRLSINPLAHLDVLGTVMLVLAGFGWAKPVPINPNNFRNYREGMIKVSFAGPGANLFLCFISIFILLGMAKFGVLTNGTSEFLRWTMIYNVWFAFFNLIPIPPLDGSQLLAQFLPAKTAYEYENLVGRYGFVILIVIVFSGLSNLVIGPLSSAFIKLCYSVVHLVF
jgi:Zn-dependent protease